MRCLAGVGYPMSRCRHTATRSVRILASGREAEVCKTHWEIASRRGLYLYVMNPVSNRALAPRLYSRDDLEVVDVA